MEPTGELTKYTTGTICLGSNVDNARDLLTAATVELAPMITGMSPIYDDGANAPYYNLVAEISTACSVGQLIELFKQLEQKFGRNTRDSANGIIALDIDLVVYNGVVLRSQDYATNYFKKGLSLLPTSHH